MAKVIPFPDQHIISRSPFKMRWAEWETRTPIMVGLQQAALFEEHLEEINRSDQPISFVPPHVPLTGGPGQTMMALFRYRRNEKVMKQVYFLAGLMELAIRMPHDLLRTDLIRLVFEKIQDLSHELGLRWSSDKQGFLLPLPENLYPGARLAHCLESASTYKELLNLLQEETRVQFNLAGKHFVYYLPKMLMN